MKFTLSFFFIYSDSYTIYQVVLKGKSFWTFAMVLKEDLITFNGFNMGVSSERHQKILQYIEWKPRYTKITVHFKLGSLAIKSKIKFMPKKG